MPRNYDPEEERFWRDLLPQADLDKLATAAVADWAAERLEHGAQAPVGNTSSVNTGESVSRVTRIWSKYHE